MWWAGGVYSRGWQKQFQLKVGGSGELAVWGWRVCGEEWIPGNPQIIEERMS